MTDTTEAKLLALLEGSVEEYVCRYVARLLADVPEYRAASEVLRAESAQSARAILVRGIEMVRDGVTDVGDDYRRALQALGRRRAETAFPLQAAIRGFEIGTRVFWELAIEEAERAGLIDAATLQKLFGLGLNIYATCVADFTESYLTAQDAMHGRMFDAVRALLVDVMTDGFSPDLARRAATLDVHDSAHYAVLGTPILSGDNGVGPHDQWTIAKRTADALERTSKFAVVGHTGVLVVEGDVRLDEAACALKAALAELARTDSEPLVVVGSPRPGLEGLRIGLAEMAEVVDLARQLKLTGVRYADELVLHRLVAASPVAREQLAGRLARLLSESNGTHLVETLRCFLANDCNTARTAEALFLHRNTLRYRLRRIETLVELPIASNRVMLELALLSADLGR